MSAHVKRANQYIRDVLSDKIPACKWVKLACRRQLDDLARARTEDFPYYFDEDAADKVCFFIENLTHVSGKWAKRDPRDPTANRIRLEPWQQFHITTAFGWKRVDNGKRRFREVDVFVPRKNGKSTIEAAIGLYMLMYDDEEGAQVYCGATSLKQARMVFTPAWLNVQRDEEMREHFGLSLAGTKDNPKSISHEESTSVFEALIGKPGDGTNPHLAIVDEYHEHPDDTMVSAMETGMGSREQPMLRIITTAGEDIAGPCYQKQIELQQILEGTVRADTVFGIIYTVDEDDDWSALESAIKANPNFGVSVLREFILAELDKALRNPSKQSKYKTKHLNIWVGSSSPYFNLEAWLKLGDPTLKEEDFVEEPCWVATDAAAKNDLSSTMRLYRKILPNDKGVPQEHYYFFGTHYLPEGWIYDSENPNKQYQVWYEQGWITATDGYATDYQQIEDELLEFSKAAKLQSWSFDPMYLRQMSQNLDKQGVTVIEVAQNVFNHSAPMKEWQVLILDGRVHHNGDPVLAWAVGNTTAYEDYKENVYPRKDTKFSTRKIDPVVAGIMALGRCLLDNQDGESVYQTGGLMLL